MAHSAKPIREAIRTAVATLITGGTLLLLDILAKLIDRAL